MTALNTHDNLNYGIQVAQSNAPITANFGSETPQQACLWALRVTDPRSDKNRIEETNGGLLKESYRWILENQEFREWRNNQSNCLLWIKGDPGKGKTMLLCGIIDELTQSNGIDSNISFFFCQATDARINNSTAVLRGLIYLLVDQSPSLLSHVQAQYDKAGKALFEGPNAWSALSAMFKGILRDPSLKSTYLIIDALDECTTGLRFLLDMVVQESSAHSNIKWIVSSRNWPDIEERLGIASHMARIPLELNNLCVSEAVKRFIQHKVLLLANAKGYSDSTYEIIHDHLVSNSQGTFLWVALVCQNLDRTPSRHAIKKLEAFPPGLSFLYDRMLSQLYQSEDSILCKQILGVISTVYRPITLDELNTLIEEPYEDDLSEIIADCGSFLSLQKTAGSPDHNTVTFVHQSAKDFLLKGPPGALNQILPRGIEAENHRIFAQSLGLMSKTLRRDMFGIKLPGFPIHLVESPSPNPLAATQYACVYWVDHLADSQLEHSERHAGMLGTAVERCLHAFLQQKYLYWLEALSLLRCVSYGVQAMKRLEILTKERGHSRALSDRAHDALRFIQYFKTPLESTPLQVYYSPLIFSPTRSSTKSSFQAERPNWILNSPVIEQDWGPCIQTIEGRTGSVRSIAWSPDGSKLASVDWGNTILILDSATGQAIHDLQDNTFRAPIAWSPDGTLLASGSYGGVIRIRETTTGTFQTLQIFKDHGFPEWVAWSPNGSQLASASADNKISIWELATGQSMLSWKQDTVPLSAAWSPDGSKFALGCKDTTIRILDSSTFQNVQILRGHSGQVDYLTWSPDGSQLASGYDRGEVIIWSLNSGQAAQTFKPGHNDRVLSVYWSPEGGRFVASDARRKAIKIWDTATGQCLHILEGHSDSVTSCAFSPGAYTRLASGSIDGTIRIWDLATHQSVSTLKGHIDDISKVISSPNGSQFASMAYANGFKIWDPVTGQSIRTFGDHGSIRCVAWPPDGSPFMSVADGFHVVRIWDFLTGQFVSTLKGHSDNINSLAWSPDGSQLASASDDNTVRIWEPVATSQNVRVLQGHTESVTFVAWSKDGSRIASTSYDKTVRIWDSAATDQSVLTLEGHNSPVTTIAWSKNGSRLALVSLGNLSPLAPKIYMWDLVTGQNVWFCEMHNVPAVSSICWSLDGSQLATASLGDIVTILDAVNGRFVSRFRINSPWFLEFDDVHCNHLHTSMGTYDIGSTSASSHPRQIGYGLNDDYSWVTHNGENVLWLPAEYRPNLHWSRACHLRVITATGYLAIGRPSGHVIFLALANLDIASSPFKF